MAVERQDSMNVGKAMLKKTIETLININGIEVMNETLAEIFNEQMNAAIAIDDRVLAQYFDELSSEYDEINRRLLGRPFRTDLRKDVQK